MTVKVAVEIEINDQVTWREFGRAGGREFTGRVTAIFGRFTANVKDETGRIRQALFAELRKM